MFMMVYSMDNLYSLITTFLYYPFCVYAYIVPFDVYLYFFYAS